MQSGQLVVFELDANLFALDIADVREILRPQEITRMPQSPPHVEGVINLRGRIIPVINLRQRLGVPRAATDHNTRIILLSAGDTLFGMVVDRVLEVSAFQAEEVEGTSTVDQADFLKGIVRKPEALWLILNPERIAATTKQMGGN